VAEWLKAPVSKTGMSERASEVRILSLPHLKSIDMELLHNFWLIQGIGALALVFLFFTWNAKTRKDMFFLQSINLVLFSAHYLLLAAYAGAAMCVGVLARNYVFGKKGEEAWASHVGWVYFFIAVAIASLAVFWHGWISLLPVAGTVVGTYGMWSDKPSDIRFYMLIASSIWIPYTIAVHSYSGLISQFVAIVGILIGMYRHDRGPSLQ
jgi:hypothetical protein